MMKFGERVFWMIVAAVIIMAVGKYAMAEEHNQHPPEHQKLHEEFYKHWKRPDLRTASCCSSRDCAPAKGLMHKEDGSVWVESPWTGNMIMVPPSRMEPEAVSPDSQAHVCIAPPMSMDGGPLGEPGLGMAPEMVLCFTYGGGV